MPLRNLDKRKKLAQRHAKEQQDAGVLSLCDFSKMVRPGTAASSFNTLSCDRWCETRKEG